MAQCGVTPLRLFRRGCYPPSNRCLPPGPFGCGRAGGDLGDLAHDLPVAPRGVFAESFRLQGQRLPIVCGYSDIEGGAQGGFHRLLGFCWGGQKPSRKRGNVCPIFTLREKLIF